MSSFLRCRKGTSKKISVRAEPVEAPGINLMRQRSSLSPSTGSQETVILSFVFNDLRTSI
jgi:hypothetical protein